MPRQIDLFPQNLQVTNDPNNQISVTAAQINNLKDQIPAALEAAEKLFLNNVLTAIDQATGLDLVDWLADAQAFFNSISASLQQSWLNLQNFLNGLAQTADADVTLALQWLQGQFNQLQALLQQSWLSFQNLLNGIIQEADADVAAVVAYLNDVGESATKAWTQIEDFITTGDWSDLTTAWNDLMLGIFGSSTSLGLVGLIPAPAVVNVTQNLQPVWDFPDSASVSAAGQWSWDGSQDHTGVTGSGSAKYVCNGALGALRGIPGAVSPSQTVTPTAWVMWSGLSAAGGTSPIQLELIPYSGAGSSLFAGTPVTIASVTSPGSSHAWEELTGTYTVPSSGVTAVQLRLVVTADATAGSIWWDDCQADLSGGFLADLQSDTNDIINSFAPGGTVGEFQTGVTNLLALFGLTPADVGGATVIDTVWTDVINDIINPLNALEISAINGLATALSALLGTTTFQTLIDSVANALGHSGTGHTITNIETYLGLIPPTNVTNVLGGANLGADVSSVHSTATNASTWSTRLTNDLLITSDVFHLTYQAGSVGDAPGTLGTNGKPTWYSAWNDLLSLAGIVNSTSAPTDAAPAVAAAITTAQTTASTAQSTLNTTNTNLFGSTTPAATIQTAAVPSGIAATKISNVLGGANLGADVSSVHTTATNGAAWATRLTNDLLVTSDVFHLVYAAGTPTDAPGTLSGGKPTWYSCWNDLLALTGTVNSVTAPTDAAPAVAAAVTTAQSSAMTANSNASAALTQLTAIPQQIVVPDLSGGASSVTFDNAGSGGSATNSSGSVSTPLSCTGTQTIGSTASIMVAAVTFSLVGSGSVSGNAQVSIGGQQMQSLGNIVQLSSVTEYVEFFILWNPPVGASQTVTATSYAAFGGVGSISFESASYVGATSISTLITNSGGGTSLSLSVPAAIANTMAVAAFSAGDVTTKANTALSSFTKTQRGNTTVQVNSTQYGYQSLAFGDSVGGSGGVTFGATGADAFAIWAGVGIVLSATSVIGSGFRAIAAGGVAQAATSGTHQIVWFNSGTFTDDYSYNTSTCTLTVANAGWYAVKISFLTSGYTSVSLGPILYQNGSIVQYGISIAPSSGAIVGDSFLVYCNAGDTLNPGYSAATSLSGTFAAETSGTKTYFEVALMNRSLL